MRKNLTRNAILSKTLARNLLVNVAAFLILSFAQPLVAQTQKTFDSAGQASHALYKAVESKDDQALQSILGAAPDLISTGSNDLDRLERERFVHKYREMHRLVHELDGSTVLYVGAENWPFPIPLVAADGKWRFDSGSGSQEVRARELGENEGAAIEVCRAVAKATGADTFKTVATDPAPEFARRLVGSEKVTVAARQVFHGYSFRVSKDHAGNTLLVAHPEEYGTSGVMTFVVSGNNVYERDLGAQTSTVADKIEGKPKGKWYRVE